MFVVQHGNVGDDVFITFSYEVRWKNVFIKYAFAPSNV